MKPQIKIRGNQDHTIFIECEAARIRRNIQAEADQAVRLVEEYEQFCRDVHALYIDAKDLPKGKAEPQSRLAGAGLLKVHMFVTMRERRNQLRLRHLLNRCVSAQNEWIDSNHQETLCHVHVCRRHAQAWKAMLDFLRGPYTIPFQVPMTLQTPPTSASSPALA